MTRVRSNDLAVPDTITAGQTFITNLPDSLSHEAIVSFRGIELPAHSWLLNRSFFWRTSREDRGEHEFWFRAVLSDDRVDSVAVRVFVD